MSENQLSGRFAKITAAAQEANEKIRAAGEHAREQVEADATRARDRATQAADHLKETVDGAHDKTSEHRQDLADTWNAHIAKIRSDLTKKKEEHEAKEMRAYAEIAEGYALDAIDFAQAAVYEAEYAVLDALAARTAATAMAP